MLRFVVQIYKFHFKLSHIIHKKLLFNTSFNLPQIACSLFFEFKTTKRARPKILKFFSPLRIIALKSGITGINFASVSQTSRIIGQIRYWPPTIYQPKNRCKL